MTTPTSGNTAHSTAPSSRVAGADYRQDRGGDARPSRTSARRWAPPTAARSPGSCPSTSAPTRPRRPGDRAEDLGHVQNVAGLVAFAQSRRDDARAAFAAALRHAGDDALRAAVLNNLARAQSQDGDRAGAVRTARRALELAVVQGDRHRLAALHSNMADRLHEAGDPDGAMEQMKLAAALFAEVGSDPLRHPDVWTLTAW